MEGLTAKEFSSKVEKTLSPHQLAVVEKYYIRDIVSHRGPALAIFDPAIAESCGISMAKLKTMKKLRRKLKAEESRKRSELTRAGFKFIRSKVDKETRAKINEYFGELPKWW